MELPDSIPMQELLNTHAAYNPDLILDYEALYHGGQKFDARMDRFLIKRPIEDISSFPVTDKNTGKQVMVENTSGSAEWRNRKKHSTYNPVAGGRINYYLGALFQAAPKIIARPKKDKDGKEATVDPKALDYWNSLNTNADGNGSDLETIVRDAVRNKVLHNRGYFAFSCPKPEETDKQLSVADVKTKGLNEARINSLEALNVDDWEDCCIRTHTVDQYRIKPYGPMTHERHTFKFHTPDSTTTYMAEWEIKKKPKNVMATKTEVVIHELGSIPIIEIKMHDDLWMMDRIAGSAKGIYNARSRLTFLLNKMGFPIPHLASDEEFAGAIDGLSGAMKTGKDGKFDFASPDANLFNSLRDDINQMKADMDDAFLSTALNISTDNSGRESGVAKFREQGAINIILKAMAGGITDSLEKVTKAILEMRDEEDLIEDG